MTGNRSSSSCQARGPAAASQPATCWATRLPLSPMMIAATRIARAMTQGGLTNSPMRRRSLVNRMSGTTAKASWRLSTTWESTSSSSTACSPRTAITTAAGMIASPRLMSRRSQGWMRMRRKPSMTICPASVPVMVLAWPEHSSATANTIEASEVPSSGASRRCASSSCATSGCPPRWNTAAARIRIAAFTNSAALSATTESTRFMRQASRLPATEPSTARLWTSALWR